MLRDYRWKIESDYELDDYVTLKNPEFKVIQIDYYPEKLTANITVAFTEGLYYHARTYPYVLQEGTDEGINASNIISFISFNFPTAIQIEPSL